MFSSRLESICITRTMERVNQWEGDDVYVYRGGKVQENDKKQIKQVRIHESATRISHSAFDGCTNLENVIIDESAKKIKHIGKGSFRHCTSLTNIDFGTTNIETIDCEAFLGCTKLVSIRLPSTTKYINKHFNQNEEKPIYHRPPPANRGSCTVLDKFPVGSNYRINPLARPFVFSGVGDDFSPNITVFRSDLIFDCLTPSLQG